MNKLLKILFLLGIFLGLGISCASAADVTVSFDPQTVELNKGSSQNVQIVMNEVPAGLSGFNITISIKDPTIAEITSVSSPDWNGVPVNSTSTSPSNSVWIKAVNFDQVHAGDTNVLLGTIIITAKKSGTSNLNIVPTEIDDANGDLINPDVISGKIHVLGNTSPVSPVANFNSNVTNGYSPFYVQFTDASLNANSWEWAFGDGTASTEPNPVHMYSTTGNYKVTLKVSNANGTDFKNATILVFEGSSGSDSSSGTTSSGSDSSSGTTSGSDSSSGTTSSGSDSSSGTTSSGSDSSSSGTTSSGSDSSSSGTTSSSSGGAGGSPEPQNNVEVKEISQAFVASGSSVIFDFPQKVTSVVNLSFSSKKTAGKTTTIVEMLKGKSTLVSELPSDEVYKFLNIWIGNGGFGESNNIEDAVVNFKVEKTWITDKNIEQSSITLNRYNDNKWNQLPTDLTNEDDSYLYFTAKTPGFSPFAITGKIIANKSVNESQSKPNIQSLEQNVTEANIEQTQKSNASEKGSTKTPGFEAVFGIVVCLLAVYLHQRK
jgi:PGF-pre-PGF domain-containing protein